MRDYYFSTTFEICEPCSEATSNSALFILGVAIILTFALTVWLLLNPALLRLFLRPRFVNLASNLVHWVSQLWSESLVAQCKIVWTGKSAVVQLHTFTPSLQSLACCTRLPDPREHLLVHRVRRIPGGLQPHGPPS